MLIALAVLLIYLVVINTVAVYCLVKLRDQVRRDMNDIYILIRVKVSAFLQVFRKAKEAENK